MWPRPAVLSVPPGPRPTRFLRLREPGAGLSSLSFTRKPPLAFQSAIFARHGQDPLARSHIWSGSSLSARTRPCDLLLNLEQELDLIDLSEHRWRGWHFDGIADALEAQGFDGLDLTGGASDRALDNLTFIGRSP